MPHGNGEQELNARPVADAGGGVVIADADLTSDVVASRVIPLVTDPDAVRRMGAAAAGAGHRGAATEVARIVLETARRHRQQKSHS